MSAQIKGTVTDTGNNPAPAETGTFDPTDVAKPKDGKKLKIGAALGVAYLLFEKKRGVI